MSHATVVLLVVIMLATLPEWLAIAALAASLFSRRP